MLKKIVLLMIFVLTSYSAHSQTFEGFRMFNGFTETDTTGVSTDYVRINKYITVDFNLLNGIPTDGSYINTSDYSFYPAISYASFAPNVTKAQTIIHPQINYEYNIMKFYSFSGSYLIVMDVLTGSTVFQQYLNPTIDAYYGYTITDDMGDPAFIFDYSSFPDGAYFIFLLNTNSGVVPEISAAGLLEKPKCDIIPDN